MLALQEGVHWMTEKDVLQRDQHWERVEHLRLQIHQYSKEQEHLANYSDLS